MPKNTNMEIKTILADSYRFFTGNFNQIAMLCLPILVAVTALEYSLLTMTEFRLAPYLSGGLQLLIYPIYTAALILLMVKRANREQPSSRELIISALTYWWPLFLLNVLASFMIGVGFILLIIPGVWVAVRLSFSEFFLIMGRRRPIDAIRQSYQGTRQYFWVILLSILCVALPIWVITFLLEKIIEETGNSYVLNVIADTGTSFLGLFVNIVIFRIFMAAISEQDEA